jgi:hypothetical protein
MNLQFKDLTVNPVTPEGEPVVVRFAENRIPGAHDIVVNDVSIGVIVEDEDAEPRLRFKVSIDPNRLRRSRLYYNAARESMEAVREIVTLWTCYGDFILDDKAEA